MQPSQTVWQNVNVSQWLNDCQVALFHKTFVKKYCHSVKVCVLPLQVRQELHVYSSRSLSQCSLSFFFWNYSWVQGCSQASWYSSSSCRGLCYLWKVRHSAYSLTTGSSPHYYHCWVCGTGICQWLDFSLQNSIKHHHWLQTTVWVRAMEENDVPPAYTTHCQTTAYHPSANGHVECIHQ